MAEVQVISTQALPLWVHLNPLRMPATLWRHRGLIRQLVVREIAARYRGSALGIIWSFLLPLAMLAVYTFVFGVIFQSRWDVQISGSKIEFALTLFCALQLYSLFSETVGGSTGVVVSNPSYVKRVVFPLEILPIVRLGTAGVHAAISFGILIVGVFFFLGPAGAHELPSVKTRLNAAHVETAATTQPVAATQPAVVAPGAEAAPPDEPAATKPAAAAPHPRSLVPWGYVSPTLVFFPAVLVPLLMLTMGLSWFLASLGVYVRDISHAIGVILNVLFFMTPIFYPMSAVPQAFRAVMQVNQLSIIVENARRTVLYGQMPDWLALGIATLVGALIMQLGYVWFMKTKRGFADVL